jgi:hypothetical protein
MKFISRAIICGTREYDQSLMEDIIPILLRFACTPDCPEESLYRMCMQSLDELAHFPRMIAKILSCVCVSLYVFIFNAEWSVNVIQIN